MAGRPCRGSGRHDVELRHQHSDHLALPLTEGTSERRAWVDAAAIIVVLTVYRFWASAHVELAADEAYYWLWSRAARRGLSRPSADGGLVDLGFHHGLRRYRVRRSRPVGDIGRPDFRRDLRHGPQPRPEYHARLARGDLVQRDDPRRGRCDPDHPGCALGVVLVSHRLGARRYPPHRRWMDVAAGRRLCRTRMPVEIHKPLYRRRHPDLACSRPRRPSLVYQSLAVGGRRGGVAGVPAGAGMERRPRLGLLRANSSGGSPPTE